MRNRGRSGRVLANEPADEARHQRTVALLQQENVRYHPSLPVVVLDAKAQVRSAREIAERLMTMWVVCVYSEARETGETWEEAQRYCTWADEGLGGRLLETLSPEEVVYLATREPEPREVAKFGWRYECCYVLMWALGIIDELGRPESPCDVSAMARRLWPMKSIDALLAQSRPRPDSDLLDAANLILHYDWACVDARINGRGYPAGLNGEVSVEWHYAFNWLVGANENADWDDISPDT